MKNLWQHIKLPLLTAGFVLLGLFLYNLAAPVLPFPLPGTPSKGALFTADGTGEVSYVPDTALLYLGVNKKANTQEEAKNQANKVINQITEDLKKLGIDKKYIKTTNFSVNENYDYGVMPLAADSVESSETVSEDKMLIVAPNRPKIRGYVANVNLEVRVTPLEKAEQVIDSATKAGATQVGTSQLIISEDKQKELEDQARLDAIKKAKEKAKSLSNAAGIRLGKVVAISENGGGYPRPYLMLKAEDSSMRNAAGTAAMPPTQIEAGENKVSVSVTLSYETY